MKRVGEAMNLYCRSHAHQTEERDARGRPKHDVALADVTRERIENFAEALAAQRAADEICSVRALLKFAVREGYLLENPARGVARRLTIKEKVELAQKDITIDCNGEVQIALDIGAKFPGGASGKPGGLLWIVVLRYYGSLRVESELAHFDPANF